MGMGMPSVQWFMLTWTVATAAMMAPSALPFVVSFARRSPRWPLPTLILVTAYLLVWAVFGALILFFSRYLPLSMPAAVATGLAIAFVGLYSFTPWMRLGQSRCIAMCARSEPIGRQRVRTAAWEGATYGVNCLACSGGVMLALVLVGMSDIAWMAAGSALILLYKTAGGWPRRLDVAVSATLVVAGTWLLAA